MRLQVETTSTPLTGWDKKATERPTAFMMVTKCTGVIILKHGHDRQLARPLSVVPQQSLTALDAPVACFTGLTSGEGEGDDGRTPRTAADAEPPLVGHRSPADTGQDHGQPPGTGTRPAGREGHSQP